ncbi:MULTISPECIES: hypothetical protein [unclassified Isoptericola]|uniref:hypothetical protein n=1 Tax=unclassified Isoptericola TaxID=2623355 RepID=UPI0035EE9B0A|nr:hypothetical protein [Isoptericola sp. QY 916]
MIVRIQLLARLLRIRLLRVEGVVAISDGDLPPGVPSVKPSADSRGAPVVHVRVDRDPPALGSGSRRPDPALGRDLAAAEAILGQVPSSDRRNRESS